MAIELNKEFQQVLDLMNQTTENLFITGRAGTGKSTLLNYFRSHTAKQVVVLAPTGVAALNVAGQTIHSFFGFKPDITLQKVKKLSPDKTKIYKKLEAVIIDEISMVRADLLDCVDKFLRLNGAKAQLPFGGCQMVFIGDVYQLPPVVSGAEGRALAATYTSPYFFASKVCENFSPRLIELEKVYRQKDRQFIDLLNAVRNNSATEADLQALNSRCQPDFEPPPDKFFITITTTNDQAAQINRERLAKLAGKTFSWRGQVQGRFDQKSLPTEVDLNLKVGAQVMFLNNDSKGRWVNGSVGQIVNIKPDPDSGGSAVLVKIFGGGLEKILPHTWDMFNFRFNERKKMLESEVVGSFTQYPLRLAWAITIHKSQGKTFDQVIIDIGRGTFAHGQMYVALSRCSSFAGLTLKKPIRKNHIFMDWRVVRFMTNYQYRLAEQKLSLEDKIKLIEQVMARQANLDITYLKANDVKSSRVIRPERLGQFEYLGKSFQGVSGFCFSRQEERVFRLDRILEIKEAVKTQT